MTNTTIGREEIEVSAYVKRDGTKVPAHTRPGHVAGSNDKRRHEKVAPELPSLGAERREAKRAVKSAREAAHQVHREAIRVWSDWRRPRPLTMSEMREASHATTAQWAQEIAHAESLGLPAERAWAQHAQHVANVDDLWARVDRKLARLTGDEKDRLEMARETERWARENPDGDFARRFLSRGAA